MIAASKVTEHQVATQGGASFSNLRSTSNSSADRSSRNDITEMVNFHNRKPAMGCDIFDFHLYRGFSRCCFCLLARCF